MLFNMHRGNYCAMISLPLSWQKPADIALGSVLMGGSVSAGMIEQINPWIAFAGGMLGLVIAGFRVYEIIRGLRKKK